MNEGGGMAGMEHSSRRSEYELRQRARAQEAEDALFDCQKKLKEAERLIGDLTKPASQLRGAVSLTDEEASWLKSAARRAAEDTIVPGAADQLRRLANKLARRGAQ